MFKSKVLLACVLALLLGTAQVGNGAPPLNDDLTSAKTVGNVTNLAFDTTDATVDGPELCMRSQNIWYCYTATCTGAVTISLCGSSFDTRLAVYNGCSSIPTLEDMVRCNDDFCIRQSQVTFPVTAGNKYLIEVAGFNPNVFGEGIMNITCDGEANPPANDDWYNALPVGPVGDISNLAFDTTVATSDGPGVCMTTPNIWYCYTSIVPYICDVTVSLCGSEFDTMLAVYNGCETGPTLSNLIECNDDNSCGYQSEITFVAIPGNQYLIEVGGFNADETSGKGEINISSDNCLC